MGDAKTAIGVAAALLALALLLAIVGLIMDALRWLLIVAALVLLVGGAIGWISRSRSRGSS